MEANVKMVWLIVECPHCHTPNVVNKYVLNNAVPHLLKGIQRPCEFCDKEIFIRLTMKAPEVDG